MALTQTQVSQLYVAVLGRASEGEGNTYWQAAASDLASGANAMLASQAAIDYFGATMNNNADFIEHIYTNVFEKSYFADEEGQDYWTARLDSGVSKGQVVAEIIDAAQSAANAGAAQTTFNNKVSVSNYAADTIQTIADTDAALAVFAGYIADVDDSASSLATAFALISSSADATDDGTSPTTGITSGTQSLAYLTVNQDILTGTAEDDTFLGYIFDNQNTAQSGDVLKGGAGTDSLYSDIGNSQDFAITLDTNSIEKFTVRAQAIAADTNDNNMTADVQIDAQRMVGTDYYASDNSRADLIIEDVRIDADQITKDITVAMVQTDPGDVDFSLYFDQPSLRASATTTSGGSINLDIMDVKAAALGNDPLSDNPYNFIHFDLGATSIRLELLNVEDINTYDQLLAAVQAALVVEGIDDTVTAAKSGTFTTIDSDSGTTLTGDRIVLTNSGSEVFTEQGWSADGVVPATSEIYVSQSLVSPTSSSSLVTSTIILDDVGRGSMGGDLIVGGLSTGLTSDSTGVEQFDITVLRSSELGVIDSTNNTLENVYIKNDGDSSTDNGDLVVEGSAGLTPFGGDLSILNADGLSGDLNIGQVTAALNVDTFSAIGGGDVTYNANIDGTEKSVFTNTTGAGTDTITVALDGDAVDTTGTSFAVTTNGGADTVTVNMVSETAPDGVSVATMALLDNLDIDTSTGADTVHLNGYGTFDITTGSESDYVRINSVDNNGSATTGTWTFGNATGVDTFGAGFGVDGVGSDTAATGRVLYNATLTLSFAGFEETVSIDTDSAGNFIANQLTINKAIEAAIAANPELTKLLNVTSGTGEQQITITSNVGGDNSLAIAIYQPQLIATGSTATDGSNVLIASADVDALEAGLIATTTLDSDELDTAALIATNTDLMNDFYGSIDQDGGSTEATWTTKNISHDVALTAGTTDAGTDIFDGGALYQSYSLGGSSDSTTGYNLSTIDLGDGANDLVVLHSRDNNINTIKISETFGKVSVVNFHNEATNAVAANNGADVGLNALDFSAYLTNTTDPSTTTTTTDSATPIATTVNIVNGAEAFTGTVAAGSKTNTNIAAANSVNVIRFVENATDTFDSLTATNLVAAFNSVGGASDYGNLTRALLSPADLTTAFIGTTQKHIVMVENNLNEGEYKVFSLSTTVDATTGAIVADTDDFDTSATLLGTLDFGASVNLNVAGSTDYVAAVAALETAFQTELDGGVVVDPPVDTTAPTLVSLSPVDDATDVAVGANLVLTFDETVAAGTGAFRINDLTDTTASAVVIPATGSAATFNGTTVTLNPATDLVAGHEYSVLVQATAVVDSAGNAFAGILDSTSFTFTTAADVPSGYDNLVTMEDLQTYDATTGDNAYAANMGTGVLIATITGFANGDSIDIDEATYTSADYIITTTGTTEINFIAGDLTDYAPSWLINLEGVDATVVADVVLAGTVDAQLAVLDAAFGDFII
ncbi:Ig-like domain-containing protein [Desulfobacula phenolica]|uniref:SbsA Ig-like domain-containing protein n=1 Tax=Desulfobacula phenolica TaxID=90732 RepID=A0A1H2DQP8_9BACT|nr:Ig-like domain-containing protein [Desulfobacula phenolica]SDT84688.1 protein of unknown function [Desulfobacula phenolica]